MQEQRPTQTDVARAAGVSRALVSIVFRDVPGASPENRDRVRAAAAALGYVPDQRAQLLGRKRTGVIGVAYSLEHDFHAGVVEHLYDAAERAGFGLVLSGFGRRRSEAAAVGSLLAYRCEGLVIVGPSSRSSVLAEIGAQVPTVIALRPITRGELGVVRSDDPAGATSATQHLIDLGHRRLVHLDGGRAPGSAERRRAFLRTVQRAGVSGTVLAGGSTEAEGVAAGQHLLVQLGRARPPTGAVVFNDHLAVGVLASVRRAGYEVPQDLSVIGFDDIRLASVPGVDLSTIRQDLPKLAARAIDQLIVRLADPSRPAEQTTIAPDLVIRGTTGPV